MTYLFKMGRRIPSLFFLWGGWLAGFVSPTWAIDVAGAAPPQEIADRQLTVGPRTLALPQGHWTFIAQGMGTRQSAYGTVTTYTAYAMNTQDKKMVAAVVLHLPLNSVTSNGRQDDPCNKVERALFMDAFNSGFKFPECLVVRKAQKILSGATGNFYSQAERWTQAENIALAGPYYDVSYYKFAANDYGWVRVLLPVREGLGDQEAIAWAKNLPSALSSFFVKSSNTVELPPFP